MQMQAERDEAAAWFRTLRDRIVHLRMLVEATLDFPEEEIDFLEKADARGRLSRLAAALAAAGAIQEAIAQWSDQDLFVGCQTPAVGLGAVVYPWKGAYYVQVTQRFDRCGGKRFRMLDWWESFAVSAEGRVLERQPQGF